MKELDSYLWQFGKNFFQKHIISIGGSAKVEGKSIKIKKIQEDFPNRYCKASEYSEGFVCYMDILGFSKYASDENNFEKIKDLLNRFLNHQINEEINDDIIAISIGSDSILMTVDKCKAFYDLDYFLRRIFYLRNMVVDSIGTDIRASITYGKYIHEGYKGQMFFGPAIVRAVELAEKSGAISCKYGNAYQPAGVFLDKFLFEEKNDIELYDRKYEKYIVKLDNGNYILNPYIFEFYSMSEYYVKLLSGKIKDGIRQIDYWTEYYNKEKEILKTHDIDSDEIKEKYSLYKGMIDDFHRMIDKIDPNKEM